MRTPAAQTGEQETAHVIGAELQAARSGSGGATYQPWSAMVVRRGSAATAPDDVSHMVAEALLQDMFVDPWSYTTAG